MHGADPPVGVHGQASVLGGVPELGEQDRHQREPARLVAAVVDDAGDNASERRPGDPGGRLGDGGAQTVAIEGCNDDRRPPQRVPDPVSPQVVEGGGPGGKRDPHPERGQPLHELDGGAGGDRGGRGQVLDEAGRRRGAGRRGPPRWCGRRPGGGCSPGDRRAAASIPARSTPRRWPTPSTGRVAAVGPREVASASAAAKAVTTSPRVVAPAGRARAMRRPRARAAGTTPAASSEDFPAPDPPARTSSPSR